MTVQKILIASLLVFVSFPPLHAATTPSPGSLIKLACPTGADVSHICKAVYYYGSLGTRHAFPNDKVYFTWYSDFSTVQIVSSEFLASLPLGTNVTYRPGVKMVKFASLPKVYAVSKNGLLHWVTSEAIAVSLYGADWNQDIDDVSDAFVSNYTFGSDITNASEYNPAAETTSVPTIDVDKGPAGTTSLQFTWTKDAGTRVSGSVPYIYRLADGRFRLYYCEGGGIRSALSSDGLTFAPDGGLRIADSRIPGDQESTVCDPSVVTLSDGRVRMYYKGSNGPGGPGQAIHKVYSAISSDGLAFQKEGLRIDSTQTGDNGWASVPEAVKLPDGRVRIYYVTGNGNGIASAISSDGLSFNKEAGLRIASLVDPAVTIMPDGTFLLLAVNLLLPGGPQVEGALPWGIYQQTSSDGLTFSQSAPMLQEEKIYDPTIVRLDDGRYRVLYGSDTSTSPTVPNITTKSITGILVE